MKVEITRYKSNTKKDKWRKGTVKKNEVKLVPSDSWSVAWTIAQIAAPLVKQLKETAHGYGRVPKHLVPEHLHSTYGSAEDGMEAFSEEAWDWALDEIIFAMEEIASDNANEPSFYTKVGEMNFLPIEEGKTTGKLEFTGWETTEEYKAAYFAYRERIQKGCELFGILYTSLWD